GELPCNLQAGRKELDPHPVGRLPVNQRVLAGVQKLEVLVLQRPPADVEEDVRADVAQAADGEDQIVDQREAQLEVGEGDGVADDRGVVVAAQRVEAAEVGDRRE